MALTRSVRRATLRAVRIHLLLLATATAARVAAQSPGTKPDFGPNVMIFDPATSAAKIQSTLESIFASQESSEFGAARYALLFKAREVRCGCPNRILHAGVRARPLAGGRRHQWRHTRRCPLEKGERNGELLAGRGEYVGRSSGRVRPMGRWFCDPAVRIL